MAGLGLALPLAGPAQSWASPTGSTLNGQATPSATESGNDVGIQIRYTDQDGGAITSPGNVKSTDSAAAAAPPCWYAPTYTPAQMKASMDQVWSEDSPSEDWKAKSRMKYQTKPGEAGEKDPKAFHMDETGKGYWWTGVPNPDDLADPASLNCTDDPNTPYWVRNGDTPPVPAGRAINPTILAKLAAAHLHIPDTKVSMNPATKSTVNLPTWVWFAKDSIHPVSATATLDAPGITMAATATATPTKVVIDPGTDQATVYPDSGGCPANPDGTIGTAYQPGDAKKTPPCGVTYLHASTSGPYSLRASITWKITTTVAGLDLPDGTFAANPASVPVQEIQTVTSG
ncbi:hypothetical protein BIV57_19070 [Mangrovactinospora gilvigrisea]|uniref:Enoyl reductase n=1 Tax=Mangrovactinospora gilvigrisea TaxID=1428644 RepID=A0A1J7C8E6_9ACTN|nr:hypothetical protein BIV57_19070 [Mangrovactinospora gilvigrisea]